MRTLILATAAFACASAVQAAPSTVEVAHAWSRPAAANTTGAGFMTLINRGKTPDALVRVESPLAVKVEIHRSSMAGGVMRMERQEKVAVPAGGQVVFAPGGYHLMLLNLKSALKVGDTVPATLTFASGASVKTVFKVGLAAPAMDHMGR